MGCICLCKDTNFKANHNHCVCVLKWLCVVYAYAKILILKQITTSVQQGDALLQLYMPMQRY